MSKIAYEKSKFIIEKFEMEIEDDKNVFLEGKTMDTNEVCYFGIWKNVGGIRIATINKRNINFDYSLNSGVYTTTDIIKFLQNHKNAQKINKELFFKKLDSIKSLLNMNDEESLNVGCSCEYCKFCSDNGYCELHHESMRDKPLEGDGTQGCYEGIEKSI